MIGSTIIDAQRQSLDMITDLQGRVVKANRELAQSMSDMADTLPLPEFKAPAMFDADYVSQAFDITAEWLQMSRQFTEDMVAAWMPETPKAKAKAAK